MSHLWSDLVHRLDPYVPGEQPKVDGLIKLNTNENPYPPSPNVAKVITASAIDRLRLYPDPNSQALKASLAEYFEVEQNQVFVGNGSDEVLAHAFQAFFTKDKPLLFPDISYSFYPVYCNLFDITFEKIALNAQFEIDVDSYNVPNGGIIFPNPNAPTGIALALDCVKSIAQANVNSVVLVDEAYVDFGAESAVALITECPNILVVQTFSKSRSLAGSRIGYAIADADLIDALERVKNSFNSYPVDHLTELAAIASVEDDAYFKQMTQKVIVSREKTIAALEALGFSILPSAANFIFAKPNVIPAKTLFAQLREHNIIVRYFDKPRIDEYLRISIGTDQEMQRLVDVVTALVSG